MKLINREAAKWIDTTLAEEMRLPLELLMENAGRAVADAVVDVYPGYGNVLLLVGSGNNGADALVAARHLRERQIPIVVYYVNADSKKSDLFELQRERLDAGGLFDVDSLEDVFEPGGISVVVEAIAGTGYHGSIQGEALEMMTVIRRLKGMGAKHIAVDIPIGVDADTGATVLGCEPADVTVTFVGPKPGMYLYPGKEYVGKIVVGTLGVPNARFACYDRSIELITEDICRRLVERPKHVHKGDMGDVLVIGGQRNMLGASILAAEAAAFVGAGKTMLAVTADCLTDARAQLHPDIMLATYKTVDDVLKLAAGKDVLAIGPGFGRGRSQTAFIRQLIKEYKGPAVFDADALGALGEIKTWQKMKKTEPWILTPHPGEFMDLTGMWPSEQEKNRVEIARSYARGTGTVVVLKGAPTVIASPESQVYINSTGNPGMAIGGMGDVLTGAIAGLWVQLMHYADSAAETAAALGVYLHGKAADELAKETPCGIRPYRVAEMMMKCFPKVDCSAFEREEARRARLSLY